MFVRLLAFNLIKQHVILRVMVKNWLWNAAITDVDHYGRLGIQRRSSYEEVSNNNVNLIL